MKYARGTEVKVTISGSVYRDYGSNMTMMTEHGQFQVYKDDPDVAIEVIAEPVEVFGPGCVVRGRTSGLTYTVLENGYYSHDDNSVTVCPERRFVSDLFERLA